MISASRRIAADARQPANQRLDESDAEPLEAGGHDEQVVQVVQRRHVAGRHAAERLDAVRGRVRKRPATRSGDGQGDARRTRTQMRTRLRPDRRPSSRSHARRTAGASLIPGDAPGWARRGQGDVDAGIDHVNALGGTPFAAMLSASHRLIGSIPAAAWWTASSRSRRRPIRPLRSVRKWARRPARSGSATGRSTGPARQVRAVEPTQIEDFQNGRHIVVRRTARPGAAR